MADQPFVARDRELQRLEGFLARAIAGETQTCFVLGEAGMGKTTLVQQFAQRAQAVQPELVVAFGDCNAQTGAGDPYLPFRMVLAELTGASETRAAQKLGGRSNAERLKGFLRVSGATLLQFGPDLIGTLVPGAALAAKVATFAAGQTGLAEQVRRQVARGGVREVDQAKIFEQYARVLAALAQQQPLLVVLDDLQWADDPSLDLLFHLVRTLRHGRLLIIGTYRPDDVAQDRGDERHPLAAMLNELKRYLGDVWIDLRPGRAFVDAFLDAEPNALDETFRQALFAHTNGHPLFTVELWHALQERGDVSLDKAGRWAAAEALVWDQIPARVEGVVAERLARLPGDLHDLLATASVEGVEFTTQVLARVAGVPERALLRRLASELDRRHRLIAEAPELEAGRRVLSRYRFTQTAFQRYLYDELSRAERRLLHRDVAEALEALYAADVERIVMPLAHHYENAGALDRAAEYLARAGAQAQHLGALHDAQGFYERAVALAAPAGSNDMEGMRRQGMLLCRLGMVQASLSAFAEARARLEAGLALARAGGDRATEAAALGGLGRIATETGAYAEAEARLSESLALAREAGDPAGLAGILKNLGMAQVWQGRYDAGQAHLEESLALARESGDQAATASVLMHLGHLALDRKDYAAARARQAESLALARASGNRGSQVSPLLNLGMIARRSGDNPGALAHLREALPLAREVDNRWLIAGILAEMGLAACAMDDAEREAAAGYLAESLRTATEAGAVPIALYALVGFAKLRAVTGQRERAVELLAVVLGHPATITGTRDVAEPLLAELQARLPADAFAAAQARGEKQTLEAVTAEALRTTSA